LAGGNKKVSRRLSTGNRKLQKIKKGQLIYAVVKIKLFLKNILKAGNALVGFFLPKIDLRKKTFRDTFDRKELLSATIVKGNFSSYHYDKSKSPYWISLFENGINVSEIYFIQISKAFIIGKGIVLNENKEIILESTIFQTEYLNKLLSNHLVLKSYLQTPGKKIKKVIPLLNRLSNNYYHWTTEVLSRIFLLSKHCDEFRNYDLLINADAPAFVRQSLTHLLGIREEKIISWHSHETAVIEDCVLISYPFVRNKETAMTNVYHPAIYNLYQLPKKCPQKYNANIIITRKSSSDRRIINENLLVEKFPDLEFKIFEVEKLDYAEQVNIFQYAKTIIAAHGAGLVNLVYCQNDPVVIELFPETRKIRDAALFYQITQKLNVQHHLIVCPALNSHQDIRITDDLLTQINHILSKKEIPCPV
jgi:Glycosyltransferase 61